MTAPGIIIAVAADSSALGAHADRLAQELEIPRCEMPCSGYPYVLLFHADAEEARLELRTNYPGAPGPVFVDFVKGPMGFRRRTGNRGDELLARAVGVKGSACPTVLDATAGLGRDGYILATLGCRVTLVERSPMIAALLRDGLARARSDPHTRTVADRIRLSVGNAVTVMDRLAEQERPDVIYLDPMYPHRNKSALVKKEMRMLRELVGEDLDAPQLLEAAQRVACKRVVVKRPRLADKVPGGTPSYVLTGSTTRFDIYVRATGPNKR